MTRPRPILIINGLTAVIDALIPALQLFGVIDWTPDQIAAVMLVVTTTGSAVSTVFGQRQVTPLTDPRDDAGNILTPGNLHGEGLPPI